jgi:hypothetical protein
LFLEQLENERVGFVRVVDTFRTSKQEKTIEDLVEEWKWRDKVRDQIQARMDAEDPTRTAFF